MKNTALYRYPWRYAQEFGEEEQYRLSRKANFACVKAIENAIASNSNPETHGHTAGINFDASTAAKQVVMEFGLIRTAYIVANHIRLKVWDGRFSTKNKEFYMTIPVCAEGHPTADPTLAISDAKAHSVIVDAFATKIRELYQLSMLRKN